MSCTNCCPDDAEVTALLSLLLLTDTRRLARIDAHGRHLDPSAAVRFQQLGLVRRRPGSHNLQLTDDASYALLLDMP